MNNQSRHFQCRHIFTDGHRCGSKCLRNENFCYYHHTSRRPVAAADLAVRDSLSTFHLPLPEDRSAIQAGIGLILQRIAQGQLDSRRAGLLLYGLQTAALNLPRQTSQELAAPFESVEEVIHDPTHGPVAPVAGYSENPRRDQRLAKLTRALFPRATPRAKSAIVRAIDAEALPRCAQKQQAESRMNVEQIRNHEPLSKSARIHNEPAQIRHPERSKAEPHRAWRRLRTPKLLTPAKSHPIPCDSDQTRRTSLRLPAQLPRYSKPGHTQVRHADRTNHINPRCNRITRLPPRTAGQWKIARSVVCRRINAIVRSDRVIHPDMTSFDKIFHIASADRTPSKPRASIQCAGVI